MKKQQGVVFSRTLRGLMRDRGLRQHHLVTQLGVTQAAVSRWYNGSIPSPEILLKLALFLNVSVDQLLQLQQPVVRREGGANFHSGENLGTDNSFSMGGIPLSKKLKISAIEKAIEELQKAAQSQLSGLAALKKAIDDLRSE